MFEIFSMQVLRFLHDAAEVAAPQSIVHYPPDDMVSHLQKNVYHLLVSFSPTVSSLAVTFV